MVNASDFYVLSCVIILYHVFLVCMHSFMDGRKKSYYKEFFAHFHGFNLLKPRNAKLKTSRSCIPITYRIISATQTFRSQKSYKNPLGSLTIGNGWVPGGNDTCMASNYWSGQYEYSSMSTAV